MSLINESGKGESEEDFELRKLFVPEIKIFFSIIWLQMQGDLSKCLGCGESIFGNMFSMHVNYGNGKRHSCDIHLCESCNDLRE